jgi:hypothetical protein
MLATWRFLPSPRAAAMPMAAGSAEPMAPKSLTT